MRVYRATFYASFREFYIGSKLQLVQPMLCTAEKQNSLVVKIDI